MAGRPRDFLEYHDAFVRELEAFLRGGYRFAGSRQALFPGTQQEAFDAYLKGIKNAKIEGYFEIPTGVGKTVVFAAIADCYLRAVKKAHILDAPRILIHEPTDDLVTQTARALAQFMPELAGDIETDDGKGYEREWRNGNNGHIGIKQKGAKDTKHIVITTYQGQAADERKFEKAQDKNEAAAKRVYKPEDFGLVIHDEAHYLTGPKFGPAAVDKFRGAIQLGVTATPEYSEDKTVANKLGHRYYELPLNTAIERGDLCHVRPIVLLTHLKGKDKIDLSKARKFLEQQHNKPLSNAQLEQLLNQEARNQAIIKAYLTGEHPDTKEGFLGQTGMIFAGGITHCSDFIRDAYKVLDKTAYREVKRWLRDEGLCLIAPIHSAVPKDGVDIVIGGKRQKFTAEQIKDLHRQGKILLLISDKQLMLGSDFPMDSFIADAVDRFSVPDATQRMGRGFRVDRGNEKHGLPPNPDKSCAAVNIIDETTHEMYKGTPHHPIHTIEILHGAEHRPPGRRKGALTRFKEHPPHVSETLEQLGFEFITRAETVRGIVRQFEEGKKKRLPDKDENWLSFTETLDSIPGGARRSIQEVVKHLTGKSSPYDSERLGIQTVTYKGQPIDLQRMQSNAMQPICIRREHWDRVEKAAGVEPGVALPKKNKDWLSSEDAMDSNIVPGGNRRAIREALKYLTGKSSPYDSERQGIQTVKYKDQSIDLQKMQASGQKPICILREHWSRVEKAAGMEPGVVLPKKEENDEHWLSSNDTKDSSIVPDGTRASIQEAVKYLTGESSPYDSKRLGIQTVNYKGQLIDLQKMQSGMQQPICIRREHWDRVERAAGVEPGAILPKKEENDEHWLSARDTRDATTVPGGNRGPIQKSVKDLTGESSPYDSKQLGIQTVNYKGQLIDLQKMRSGAHQPICIRREHWSRVEKAAGVEPAVTLPEKDEHWLSLRDTADTSIVPGGWRKSIRETVKYLTGELSPYDSKKLGIQTVNYKGQFIDLQKMQTSGGQQPICIRREHWDRVEKAAGIESFHVQEHLPEATASGAARAHLKSPRPQPQQSPARMTAKELAARKQTPPSRS